jgi:lantibiotic modifying enzyme
MTCLRFFQHTHQDIYLFNAIGAGKALLKRAESYGTGYCWPGKKNRIGLAHGASGIALFLLYLHATLKEPLFLNAAEKALSFDLAHAIETADGGYSWASEVDATSPLYPYWRQGSAGVGQAVLRFYEVSKQQKYLNLIKKIFVDTDRKLAVLPGRFSGLAGIGEFLLDAYQFTKNPEFLQSANRVGEGIRLFCVEHDGLGFPGDSLSRLCCDYGTGSAGIGLFLHRLYWGGPGDFMLDEVLIGKQGSPVKHTAEVGE